MEEIFHQRGHVLSLSDYRTVAGLKTGSLIRLACSLPTIGIAASKELIRGLDAFADYFALAFQIFNDAINKSPRHGKQALEDTLERRVTYPVIMALRGRDSMLRAYYESPRSDAMGAEEVAARVFSRQVLEESAREVDNLLTKAEAELLALFERIPHFISMTTRFFRENIRDYRTAKGKSVSDREPAIT